MRNLRLLRILKKSLKSKQWKSKQNPRRSWTLKTHFTALSKDFRDWWLTMNLSASSKTNLSRLAIKLNRVLSRDRLTWMLN